MEVKPGYKQTEVGVIPDDWEVRVLGSEIDRLEAGVSVNSVDEAHQIYPHDQSILKTSAVMNGHFFPDEAKKIAPRDIRRAQLNPRANTIIISRMNTPDLVGECGYVDQDYPNLFLPDRLWMSKFRRGSEISVKWLAYLLSSKDYKQRLKGAATGTSGSMKNLSKDVFLSMQIQYPAGHEQRAIATALSDMDGLLAKLDQLIAKKRNLKQAAMQQLLTGRTRLPGFNGEWEGKKLGDAIEKIVGGGTPSRTNPSFWGNEIPWVTVKDFGTFNPYQTQESITRIGLKNSASNLIPAGTLIASTRMALGKAVIYRVDVAINQDLKAIFWKPNIAVYFMDYWFENFGPIIQELGSGSTVKGISIGVFRQIPFTAPPLAEQHAIATVLSDIDDEIAALEARREKTRMLKQGMMQELLTGRIRLI
jgi:type I restriction enzyme, S subunit